MFDDKNSGHHNTMIVGGFVMLSLLGPIIFSGLIAIPFAIILFQQAYAWRISPGLGIVYALFVSMCIASAIDTFLTPGYSDPSMWRLNILDWAAPYIFIDRPTSRWEMIQFKYLSYSLRFIPLGILCWLGLAYKWKWYKKFWKVLKRSVKRQAFKNQTECEEWSTNVFLGLEKKTGEPVLLSEELRVRHTQVLGATGYGKTASVLKNMIYNDIRCGRGLVLIDGKGDASLSDSVMEAAATYFRFIDICYFNYSDNKGGMTYNPVINGSATEIRDRIIDALDWSEEYYKKCASSVLLLALQIFESQKIKPTLEKILFFLHNPVCSTGEVPEHLKTLFNDFRENHPKRLPEIKGLITDLNNLILSGGGKFLNSDNPDIDLLRAVAEKRIVIIQVSTLDFGMTARSLGRLIIQDLKAVCGILNRQRVSSRGLFSVYIDEFESFVHESFNELLSKARSVGMGITILHQSMGDLEKVGDYFLKQITENTNNKIILHVNDEQTVEYFANMAGTRPSKRTTYQIEDDFFWQRKTGVGSQREVEEYIIHPNVFRNLKIGEAVVLARSLMGAGVVKLDMAREYKSYSDSAMNYYVRSRPAQKPKKKIAWPLNDDVPEQDSKVSKSFF